jgi:hypothetical protein
MSSVAVLIVVSVGLLVEAEVVGGKRKTADPVGCGSVTGWDLLGGIREAHNAAGPLVDTSSNS